MNNDITISSEGRRHYIVGNTYPIKSAIKSAGCKWDRDRGAWWTGKREVAESLIASVSTGAVKPMASFAKLSDGSWGVRAPGTPGAGSTFDVESKYGRKTVTIAAIVETTDGSSLCSIVAESRKPRASNRRQPSYSDGRSFRRGDRDYNMALRNYRATGDYYSSGLYDEES